MYLDGAVSVEGFKELYVPAEERLKQLNEEQIRMQALVDVSRVNKLSAETVLREARELQDHWPELPNDEKRKIVESIIESIVVDKESKEIEITLSCLPTSVETINYQQSLGRVRYPEFAATRCYKYLFIL
jgi:hypothetical protein